MADHRVPGKLVSLYDQEEFFREKALELVACVFRSKSITDSGANRSAIPAEPDHRFRGKPISDSGGKPITFGVGTGMVQGT